MRIISKLHDYYDIGLQYGQDENVVFVRKPEPCTFKHFKPEEFEYTTSYYADDNKGNTFQYVVTAVVVGFCGKIYTGLKVSKENASFQTEDFFFYDLDSYVSFLEKTLDEEDFDTFKNKKRLRSWRSMKKSTQLADITEYFSKSGSDKYLNEFTDSGHPIFVYIPAPRYTRTPPRAMYDDILAQFEFYKKIDAYTAFQELSMFIGGVLGVSRKLGTTVKNRGPDWVDPVDSTRFPDTVLRDSKGFDKFSFKKPPTKKK